MRPRKGRMLCNSQDSSPVLYKQQQLLGRKDSPASWPVCKLHMESQDCCFHDPVRKGGLPSDVAALVHHASANTINTLVY